jgi:hypothetical protein
MVSQSNFRTQRVLFVCFLISAIVGLSGGASDAGAESLEVTVTDGRTGETLSDAFVLVGMAPGSPFVGNTGWTDPSGVILYDNPSLTGPQTVTACLTGFGHTTVFDAAYEAITIPLFPAVLDSSMAGLKTHIEGTVSGISTSSNDGMVDIALILPAVSVTDGVLAERLPFSFGMETVDIPVVGEMEVPENSYAPDQVELLFLHFEKSPWRLDLPGQQIHAFSSVSGRISLEALASGSATLDDVTIREVGVERDINVTGPMNLTINSDLNLTTNLTLNLVDVPVGSDLMMTSGTLIPSTGRELVVVYDVWEGNIDAGTTYQMATRAPGGDLSDGTNAILVHYLDPSPGTVYGAGIFDRAGFTPPHTATFNTWQTPPELAQTGTSFSWDIAGGTGSPVSTWVRGAMGIRPINAGDSVPPVNTEWRFFARTTTGAFELPVLPPEAPGPDGGLTDPDETPEADQQYWELWAANPPDDAPAVVAGFLEGATHWSHRWIPIEFSAAAVDDLVPDSRINARTLTASPNPATGPVTLRWQTALQGNGVLEIVGLDGRLIRSESIRLSAGETVLSQDLGSNHPLPAGVYWAVIRSQGEKYAERRIAILK